MVDVRVHMLTNGAGIKTVQTHLGHASAAFTLENYAHAVLEKDDEAADLMGEIISGEVKQKARVIELKSV